MHTRIYYEKLGHPHRYNILNAIDSNAFWKDKHVLLNLVKGLVSISSTTSSSVMKIKCHALLQRAVMSVVSETNTWSGNSTNEWKNGLDAASRVFRNDPNSSPWFTIVLCFIASSLQHRILIADLKLHLVLRATHAGFYGKISKRTREQCSVALAMLGDVIPPTSLNLSLSLHRHRGVRILSIDGGGTRGIGSIQTLRALQKACGGRPIYSMFDIICGTSTGGILAVALGLLRRPLDEVEQMYRNFSSRVFESSSVYVAF